MGENSLIQWTRHSFAPWYGCTRVSPGCANCYAAHLDDHRFHLVRWGAGEARVRTSPGYWRGPHAWNRKAMASGERPFVFCSHLSDVFDNEVNPQWRRDLFALIEATPALVWLLLTKRIGNAVKMIDALPYNAALGITTVDQSEYSRDCQKLLDAARTLKPMFTFASIEPMLGPVTLDDCAPDWLIVGGESGHDARMMDPDWARQIRDDCARLGRRFFMKQMTGGKKAPIPDDLLVRQFPELGDPLCLVKETRPRL